MKLAYKGWPMTFVLDPGEFRVMIGPFTLRRIAAGDIEWVRHGGAFWKEHYTNLGPLGSRPVLIRRRSGLFRNLVVNPVDPDEFVDTMRRLYALPPAPFS